MDVHLDSHAESMIERHLRSGRYQSAEEVVKRALSALEEAERPLPDPAERRKAVQEMREFAAKHGFSLGPGVRIRDLIEEGRKY